MTDENMNKNGFTLIEILIVVAIISIIGTLMMASFSLARKQGRDTQRRSDISQYRIALENYYSVNSYYPNQNYNGDTYTSGGTGVFSASGPLYSFMNNNILKDPVNSSTNKYVYVGDTSGLNYKMYSSLESGGYWEICSNGKSGATQQIPANDASVCELP
ncbi:MAG: type II secretion system GspH family protein [Patescibacteria group bacterium]|nr:type II secretion system GspH family protein [Patescibacteria group bacterium]